MRISYHFRDTCTCLETFVKVDRLCDVTVIFDATYMNIMAIGFSVVNQKQAFAPTAYIPEIYIKHMV